jgi:2-dehydro-3-deoxygalactonokinase
MVALAGKLIGADWGSSGLRVFLIGDGGKLLDTRASASGSSVMNGSAEAYSATLEKLAGDWLRASPGLPILACGMVGSKHGWREAPYLACPASTEHLATGGVSVEDAAGRKISIVPGLSYRCDNALPDVMRGEETQVVGALALHPVLAANSTMVMPGTHSKWARIEDGHVQSFATYMTGELFALLSEHSVLGRLFPAERSAPDSAGFAAGVRAGVDGADTGLSHQLFAVRTLGLMGDLAADALPGYLSGLLIGHELHAGLLARSSAGLDHTPMVLIGEPSLCALYASALDILGAQAGVILPNTAPDGLWQLALVAGLVTDRAPNTESAT